MGDYYKVGLIGCGNRGDKHALGFKADERCQVKALADIKPEAAKEINKKYNFETNMYTDYREMLQKENLDVIAICLWTDLHLPVFKDCIKTDVKAIFMEKPMAPTREESLEYAEIMEGKDCQLTFGHQRRFAEGNQLVRKWLKENKFGKILRMDLYSPPHLLDCGTHTFDQALSFNQEIPAKWVIGNVDTEKTISYFDIKAEGMAAGHLIFENGVKANIQVGGPDRDMDSGVRILGEKGFIEVKWDGDFKQGRIYDDPDWRPPEIKPEHDRQIKKMISKTLDSLEKGEEPELSYKKALRAAEIIFGLYESVRQNRRIELPAKEVKDNPLITMLEKGKL
ncbi:MAG: Gfo/Idh/MocA family protein [Halanaerobiaceae bacterium]